MDTESLLNFDPQELSFVLELNKRLSSSIRLINKSNNPVAFKLLSTNPKAYGVKPNFGILSPGSASQITVTKRPVKAAPNDMRCKDKFMIQSAIASGGVTVEDARKMFEKEAGHDFREDKLRVVYISPPPEVPTSVAATESSSGVSVDANFNVNEVPNSAVEPIAEVVQANTRKLLDVQAKALQFPLWLKKEMFCGLQLSNVTDNPVAFMVKSASSKYSVHPHVGIILPQSTCEIAVRKQSKVPPDLQCEDKFLIHSLVAPPTATTKDITPEMFHEGGSTVEECDLKVVQIMKLENLGGELLMKCVIVCLLGFVSWYLMKQTLSLIWSLSMVLVMLLMKMVKKLVSDSVEDWVVKTLLYICMHILFKRTENIR